MPNSRRTHYFRDEDDNRTVVETSLLSTGRYRAELVETTLVMSGRYRVGYGASRIGAIADLQAKIEAEGASCFTV